MAALINTRTTLTSPTAWRPDQTALAAGDVVPDALIFKATTVAGEIEGDEPSLRVPYVIDDGAAGFVPEGTEIAPANQQFAETVINTDKVAALGRYSRETMLQPNAARLILESLQRSVIAKANAALLGNPGNPTGLLAVAGVVDGGTVGANLDPLVDAVAKIEAVGGQATTIIAAPDAWASLAKLKATAGGAASLLGAGTEEATRMLLGIGVEVTPAMPAGSLLVLDRNAVVSASSPIRLDRSDDAYFEYDVVAVRVTWRMGWAVMRPNRVVKVTTAAAPKG